MPYFKGSTATPTGIRPWNFAMQGSGPSSAGLGRLGGRLRFYVNSAYPLPQASNGPLLLTAGVPGGQQLSRNLGDFLPRIPHLATSPYSGKADYGDPPPGYSPLNPAYFKGMGRLGLVTLIDGGGRLPLYGHPIMYSGPITWNSGAAPQPAPVVTATGSPLPVATGSPIPTAGGLPTATPGSITWQQQQALLAQQQAAAALAAQQQQAQSAATLAAQQASQSATTVPAAPAVATAPSWFTDPNQSLITGFPNWGLLAIAGGAFFLLKKK
jgi:hypothetical protein